MTSEYFDQLETMSADSRRRHQETGLQSAVSRASEKSVSVREMMDEAGLKPPDIQTIPDLQKLPITHKDDLIDLEKTRVFGGLLTIPVEDVARVFIAPGPLYEPLHSEDIKWFAKSFWAAGLRKGDVVVNTFTYHMSPAGVLFHEAIRDCGATAVPMGTGNSEILVRTMLDLRASYFVGTPSYLMSVINKANELGHSWKEFNIKKAWFTGEMLTAGMRSRLEKEYGVDTYQAYAVSEPGGAVAYECREKNGLHLMDEYVVEVVEPSTGKQLGAGEVGEVVVTPIHNPTWGLLRFGTGDLSSLVDDVCTCGRTAPRLTGILGRVGDSAKVRGLFVVGKQASGVFAQFPEIARAQIVIDRPVQRDEMIFRIELKSDAGDRGALSERIAKKFKDTCLLSPDRIEFVGTGMIPDGAKTVNDIRKWV